LRPHDRNPLWITGEASCVGGEWSGMMDIWKPIGGFF
jgi:hypothetical protein